MNGEVQEFRLSTRSEIYTLAGICIIGAAFPVAECFLVSLRTGIFFLVFNGTLLASLVMVFGPAIGAVVSVSDAGIEMARFGHPKFHVEWMEVAQATLEVGERRRTLVLLRKDGMRCKGIPLSNLSPIRRSEFLNTVQEHLEDVRIEIGPNGGGWFVRRLGWAKIHALRSALLIFFASILIVNSTSVICGPNIGEAVRSHAYNRAWVALCFGIALAMVGIYEGYCVRNWKVQQQLDLKRLAGGRSFVDPLANLLDAGYSEQDRWFRYTERCLNFDIGKYRLTNYVALAGYMLFINTSFVALAFQQGGQPKLGELVMTLGAVNMMMVFAAIYLRDSLRKLGLVSRHYSDRIKISGTLIFVKRGERVLPALLKQQVRSGIGTKSHANRLRNRVCLEVDGEDSWYVPCQMEEVIDEEMT